MNAAEPGADASQKPAPAWVWVVFFLTAFAYFLYLLRYYFTGAGGPTLLAVTLVPVTFILFTLDALRTGGLYPKLGRVLNYIIAGVYVVLSVSVSVYFNVEFMEIRTVRLGIWNPTDLLFGGIMFVLVMEYCRKRYFPLFVINLLLIVYTVYGWLIPGLFGHPGLTWSRVITSMSVEMTTGVFSQLPQLALILIGSFMLVLSLLQAFGCIESLLKVASRIAGLSPQALPQAAVVGSLSVAAVSGSSAANAITTGSATIPAMIGSGMPRVTAAATRRNLAPHGPILPARTVPAGVQRGQRQTPEAQGPGRHPRPQGDRRRPGVLARASGSGRPALLGRLGVDVVQAATRAKKRRFLTGLSA
jgi:TRAP-type uncharacterized transport system fused permease subunit